VDGRPRRRRPVRLDYTLRLPVGDRSEPVAVGLLEAKAEDLPPHHGLEQAKRYGRLLNVPFCFATNGHLFVEFNRFDKRTSEPRPFGEFPRPDDLRARYEDGQGFSLADAAAAPLLVPYPLGASSRWYFQDGAIRAVLEKLARGEQRALLSLATGTGKTRIASFLLWRIAKAGQLRRALFVCDRDELREQAEQQFRRVFGSDAAKVTGDNPQKNARVLIATYQTLGVDEGESGDSFLVRHYPTDFFSHIVIDECHRSAWGAWRTVLERNPNAVHIGLTATPRRIEVDYRTADAQQDERLIHDNIVYFGEPAFEYDVADAMEDGYLAACEIVRRDTFLDEKAEAAGVERSDLIGKALRDPVTGEPLSVFEAQARYEVTSYESRLVLPERVHEMCRDLFDELARSDRERGPEQKTIVFCASDDHAQEVANAMNNLYSGWCQTQGRTPREPYAFKCTAQADRPDRDLADFKGRESSHFVATTVELLTTGVDVPSVRNIVFFRYVRSPIAFYQMVGRGTRIDPLTEKLMFRVYDYTDATRLFGEAFVSRVLGARRRREGDGEGGQDGEGPARARRIEVFGFEVQVSDAGRFIVTEVDGKALPVTLEEYRERLTAKLLEEVPTLDEFRRRWEDPGRRRELLERLPDGLRSALLVRDQTGMQDYDLYDVLAELAYGMEPRTRSERAKAFTYKHAEWLASLPEKARVALAALVQQYAAGGTEALETPAVFDAPAVRSAGGFEALRVLGSRISDVLREAKRRLFAA
jgi:type I restriction enzyme R subunit